MSFTLIVVHLGARVNPLTLPIVLPSVKSIMVRVVCPLQCGQYLVRCRPEFVRFLNLINGSHGFVCDANPSSGLWLDAVWWKSAECRVYSVLYHYQLTTVARESSESVKCCQCTLRHFPWQNSLHCVPTEAVALIHTYHAVPRPCRVALLHTYHAVPRSCRFALIYTYHTVSRPWPFALIRTYNAVPQPCRVTLIRTYHAVHRPCPVALIHTHTPLCATVVPSPWESASLPEKLHCYLSCVRAWWWIN